MKNLVFIETYNRHGSGIIFPCKAEEKNSYIIITNYHVIRDLGENCPEVRDYVNLEFYDNKGRNIEREYIKSVKVAYGEVFDNENDIAALLVVLDEAFCIEFEDHVSFEDLQETLIFTEGYPEILNDNDINRRLRLEGKRENTFPAMDKLAIYKLTDSIHWYKDYTDKDLLDGLSGGPVYVKQQENKYLLGINQSLCNVGDGSNPFKIVYFIKIQQVFEWLRSQGIILFEYNSGKIKIEWIYHIKAKSDKNINILLLGGSGAGKSSFVKELLLHNREINASGDGQTTRMDIDYCLKYYCEKPMVKVKFFSKSDFVNEMVKRTNLNVIEYIFVNVFKLPHIDLKSNMLGYVKKFLPHLEGFLAVLREKIKGMEKDLSEELRNFINNEKGIRRLEKTLEECKTIICKDDEAEQSEIEILYEDIIELMKFIYNKRYVPISRLSLILNWKEFLKSYDDMEPEKDRDIKKLLINYIERILYGDYKQKNALSYEIDLFDVINVCNGFFDVREFYYLNNSIENDILILFKEHEENFDYMHDNYKETDMEDDKIGEKFLKVYYERLYEEIINAMKEYHNIHFDSQNTWEIGLDDIGKKDKEFLDLCLKVINGKSLSGIIQKIIINDSISNKYAYMLKQKGINELRFIDTCGLDHIDRGMGIKSHLNKIFRMYKDNHIYFDTIFYIKKLDAGRPTELQKMLPVLYNACPGKPVFCIFTGADIFYTKRENLLTESEWNRHFYEQSKKLDENIIPKSIAYFYENKSIVDQMPCSDEWKDIIYHVVTENLIPFVADTRIRNKPEYIISNRRYLKKLFEAILLDEWNAGYIDTSEINRLVEEQDFVEVLKNDIRMMFKKASLFNWDSKHHMTVNANVTRLLGKNKTLNSMGYNGVSEDRWDCLLKGGYQAVFLEGNSEAIKKLIKSQIGSSQSESMFAKLKDEIISVDMKCLSVEKNEKSKFRKSFERMYEKGSGHEYNPFSEDTQNKQPSNQEEKRTYLADVCDFTKGLDREEIINPFVEVFQEEIKSYINEQNKKRMELLLLYMSDFKEKIYSVIDEIESVVGKGNDEWILEMLKQIINFRNDKDKKL